MFCLCAVYAVPVEDRRWHPNPLGLELKMVVHCPFSVVGFCLIWTCVGIVHLVTVSVSSYVYWHCFAWKMFFLCSYSHPLALTIPPLPSIFVSLPDIFNNNIMYTVLLLPRINRVLGLISLGPWKYARGWYKSYFLNILLICFVFCSYIEVLDPFGMEFMQIER